MSNSPSDSTALPLPGDGWPDEPKSPGESWLPGPKPPDEGWTRRKFFFVLLFVLAFHVALIVLFGSKKGIVPRTVTNIPQLQLVDSANEFIALSDPTLFARPNPHDIVTKFWRNVPSVVQPNFDWTEPPRYLPTPANLGALFAGFMRTNLPREFTLKLKPEPKVALPNIELDATPQNTIVRFSGELPQRRPLNTESLNLSIIGNPRGPAYSAPSLSLLLNDAIRQTKVQALVDTAGNVTSAVVLKSSENADADQRALQFVRNLSFAPASGLSFGEITFTWHTIPTNSVPSTIP